MSFIFYLVLGCILDVPIKVCELTFIVIYHFFVESTNEKTKT